MTGGGPGLGGRGLNALCEAAASMSPEAEGPHPTPGLMERVGMSGDRDVINGDCVGIVPGDCVGIVPGDCVGIVPLDDDPKTFGGIAGISFGEAHGDEPGAGGEEDGPRTDPGTSTDRKVC